MRIAVILAGLLSMVALAFGWAASLHRAADTVAMLRPILGLVILLAALAARGPALRLMFMVTGGLSLVSVLIFLLPQAPGTDMRLYSKNVWFGNEQTTALAEDITAAQVDVVMLQELSGQNRGIIDQLTPDFPHQHICKFSEWSAMAVLSKHPFAAQSLCTGQRALAAARIDLHGQPVWVVSTHIPWPWPFENADAETSTEALLSSLTGPIVVAGDFNTFPWSGRLQRIRRITDTRIAGLTRPTLTYRHVPLPLDHVLAPGGGSVTNRPLLGGDHHGIVADVSL